MAILEVRNLRKAYGDLVAVEDVSFDLHAGEVFGLLGPNGAGKSTTMMMVCGLLRPDAGSILLGGEEMRPERRDLKRLLGIVPSASQAAISIRATPVPIATGQRVKPEGGQEWPRAHPLFVALDLAQDVGRGREILDAWNPGERWGRVW